MGNKSISRFHSQISKSRDNPTVSIDSSPPVKSCSPSPSLFEILGEPSMIQCEESLLLNISPDRDGREQVSPESWPFSVHGILSFSINSKKYFGSGTVIGSRFVLTSAHHIYKRRFKQEVSKETMRFYPGMNGKSCKLGEYRVIECFYPEEFKILGDEDFAVLVLDREIAEVTGCYGIRIHTGHEVERRAACVYGYPWNIRNQAGNEHYLWGMEGPFKIDEMFKYIYAEIDTSPGQSGAGVYYVENNEYFVIGVVNMSQRDGSLNCSAIYLNESRVKRIENWIKSYYQSTQQLITLNLSKRKNINKELNSILKVLSLQDFRGLKHLSLADNTFDAPSLRELSNADFTYLSLLNLENAQITTEGAIFLAEGNFTHLSTLKLANNSIGDQGLQALIRGNLKELKYLDIQDNEITAEGIRELARGKFSHLTTLLLSRNLIGNEGTRELSKGNLTNLTNLTLGDNRIDDEGVIELAKGNLTSLGALSLDCNNIGDDGIRELARRKFNNLSYLNLRQNRIGAEGAREIARGNMVNLIRLDLSGNKIGDEGAREIARGNLGNLISLYVRENEIGDEGARELARCEMGRLKVCDLWGNNIGMKAREILMRRFIEV